MKVLKYILIGLAVVGVVAWIWLSENHKQELAEEVGANKVRLEMQDKKIEQLEKNSALMRQDADRVVKDTQDLNSQLGDIRDQAAKQQQQLDEQRLTVVGASKPNLLTPHVNKATQDYFKRIQKATQP